MNIKEIRAARSNMENSIYGATVAAMEAFRAKTGVSPIGIRIHMTEITRVNDIEKRYIVGEVKADVQL